MSDYPVDEWIKEIKQGKLLSEISDAHNVNRNTISKYVREETGASRTEDIRKNPDRWERLHVEEEMSARQINMEPDIYAGRQKIIQELRERGVYTDYSYRTEVSQDNIEEWKRLHTEENMSPNQIAEREKEKFAYRTVRKYLIREDVFKPRPRGGEAGYSIKEVIEYYRSIDEKSGCWVWTGSQHGTNQYPRFEYDGELLRGHRQAFKIANDLDKIPEGEHLRHKCDRPLCVNPNHLELGTPQDNMDDKMQVPKDVHSLSHDQLRDILGREEEDWLQIAEDHNVRLATIRYILEEKQP